MGFNGTEDAREEKQTLKGRKLWVPQMSHSGAVAFAAAFRSVGIDAEVCPDSDARTLELGVTPRERSVCLNASLSAIS